MQNKPNLRKARMNVTSLITVVYENISNWTLGENEPKTNPIKANLYSCRRAPAGWILPNWRPVEQGEVGYGRTNARGKYPEAHLPNNLQTEVESSALTASFQQLR